MLCMNCGLNIDWAGEHYIRLQFWGKSTERSFELRFCSVKCMVKYIERHSEKFDDDIIWVKGVVER